MKIRLDKYDIALANATVNRKDDPGVVRQILHNICLRDGKLVAADGVILLSRQADVIDSKDDKEYLLPAILIKTIKTSPNRQAELTCADNNLSVNYRDGTDRPIDFDPSLHFKPYASEKPYPNSHQLFPKKPKKAHIALHVGLLKKLLACLPNDGVLRLGVNDWNEQLEFSCGNLDRPINGVIMPMNVDWTDFKWYGEKDAEHASQSQDGPKSKDRTGKDAA